MVTQLQPVDGSSNIAEQGYDFASRTLAVRFTNGRLYHYADVPADVAADFAAADSKGSYLARSIRPNFVGVPIDEAVSG